MQSKLTAAEKAKQKKLREAKINELLCDLSQIGGSVTARDYVDRLLKCKVAKRVTKLAAVKPKISPHKLRRVLMDGDWGFKVWGVSLDPGERDPNQLPVNRCMKHLEDAMIHHARIANLAPAVVVEPILIKRRDKSMEGTVEIKHPGWGKPFRAQLVLLATITGTEHATPILWRMVKIDDPSPTLGMVRCRCAEEIVNVVLAVHSTKIFKWNHRPVIVQGSDMVDFSVLAKLKAAKFNAMIKLPDLLSVQPAEPQIAAMLKNGQALIKIRLVDDTDQAIQEVHPGTSYATFSRMVTLSPTWTSSSRCCLGGCCSACNLEKKGSVRPRVSRTLSARCKKTIMRLLE